MAFTVKRPFFDLEDNSKPYSKGDSYSNDNEERISFLIEKGFLEGNIKKSKKRTRKKASE